ncbi:MAG TPA: hypothetical protein VKT26_04030 [Acetobacteraceae bacterium]|nr:hypothetical protein [Acetobacteraceae bacterium]
MSRLNNLFGDLFARRDVPSLPPSQVSMSEVVRDRMNRTLRRRLSDRVMDVFNESCIAGDLDTAEELLAVMLAMHRRREAAMGDRRLSTQDLDAARDDLAARRSGRSVPAEVELAE